MSDTNVRMKIIQSILNRKSLDFGMPLLIDKVLTKTAKSWFDHLNKWKIPTTRLMDVYEEAMTVRDERAMFTPTAMFNAWRRIQEAEVQRQDSGLSSKCSNCNNTGIIKYFKLGVGDVEIQCPYH